MKLNFGSELDAHLREIRHAIHRHPELSGCEEQTAALVCAELRQMPGWRVRAGVAGHGVLADLNEGVPGKKIALRADMDALHIEEETDLPFRSEIPCQMHACGHDIHTTCLLGAARLLSQVRQQLHGSVRLIFQPAEELAPEGGSRAMIRAGALEDVDEVFGMHVWPDLPHGTVGCLNGPQMAASDRFNVDITGKSCHAAKPNEGIDAVVVASAFIQAIQTIISRTTDPQQAAVLTVGLIQGGTRANIISGQCHMEGTCRTLDPAVQDRTERMLGQILDGVCAAYGASGKLEYLRGYMPVLNDPAMAKQAREIAARLFGDEAVFSDLKCSMCAEDFAFYLKETPGAFLWLGSKAPHLPYYPLHSSHFEIDEDLLQKGALLMAHLAADLLE